MPAIKKTKATEPYLKILGLDKVDAKTEITEEQIHKAWKKLSVKIHPDKATNAAEKKELEAKFIASTQARDALIALANDAAANLKANTKAEAETAAQAAVRQQAQAQREFSSAQQPTSGLGVMKTRHMPSFILIVPVGKMASIIDEFNKFVAEKTQKTQPTQTVDQSTIQSRAIQPFAPGQISPSPRPEYKPEDFKHDVFQIKNKQTGHNVTVHVFTFPDVKSMEQFVDRILGNNLATRLSEGKSPQAAASPIQQAARPAITNKFRQAITDGRAPKEPDEPSQKPGPKGGR